MEHRNQSLQEQIDNVLFNSIEAVGLRETGTIRDLDTLVIDREKATQALTMLITEARVEERNQLLDDLLDYRDELLASRGIKNPAWIGKNELQEWVDNRRLAELKQTGEKPNE